MFLNAFKEGDGVQPIPCVMCPSQSIWIWKKSLALSVHVHLIAVYGFIVDDLPPLLARWWRMVSHFVSLLRYLVCVSFGVDLPTAEASVCRQSCMIPSALEPMPEIMTLNPMVPTYWNWRLNPPNKCPLSLWHTP